MKFRDFIFCFTVLLSVFLFRKTLYLLSFVDIKELSFKKIIADIVLCTVVIVASIFGLKRMQLSYIYKCKRPTLNDFLVLLFPLFFPGIILINGFDFSCYHPFFYGGILIISILIKGLLEEFIFRGVIQGYFMRQYPQASFNRICIIAATFFSLSHLTNLQYGDIQNVLLQVIYAFYLGLLFSAIFLKTKNIWVLGIVHGVLNLLSKRCDPSMDILEQSLSVNDGGLDLGSLLGMVIVFSPILLIYFLLISSLGKSKAQ